MRSVLGLGLRAAIGGAAAALAITVAGGCAPEESAAPTQQQFKYPSETSFCTAAAQADCNDKVVNACYGSTAAADKQSCVTARSSSVACNPDHLPYHPEHAEACVAAHASLYANAPNLTRAQLDAAAEACLAVFSLGGASGAGCSEDIDCDTGSGLRCVVKGTAGSCQKPVEVTGGNDCTAPDAECVDGFYCSDAAGACLAEGTEGKACGADKPCADAFECGADVGGTCVAKTPNGGSCNTDADCQSTFCQIATGGSSGSCFGTYLLSPTSTTCDSFTP